MDVSQNYTDDRPRLVTFYVCGLVAGALMFGTVVMGVLVEARQLWNEGAATFFYDAGMRLLVGACIAMLSAAPYLMLGSASRKVGSLPFFEIAAVLMLAGQLCFMIYILLFVRSSTAPLGLLFMPLYLCVACGAIWVAAGLAREFMPGRFRK